TGIERIARQSRSHKEASEPITIQTLDAFHHSFYDNKPINLAERNIYRFLCNSILKEGSNFLIHQKNRYSIYTVDKTTNTYPTLSPQAKAYLAASSVLFLGAIVTFLTPSKMDDFYGVAVLLLIGVGFYYADKYTYYRLLHYITSVNITIAQDCKNPQKMTLSVSDILTDSVRTFNESQQKHISYKRKIDEMVRFDSITVVRSGDQVFVFNALEKEILIRATEKIRSIHPHCNGALLVGKSRLYRLKLTSLNFHSSVSSIVKEKSYQKKITCVASSANSDCIAISFNDNTLKVITWKKPHEVAQTSILRSSAPSAMESAEARARAEALARSAAAANPPPSSSGPAGWLTGEFEDIQGLKKSEISGGTDCKIYSVERTTDKVVFKGYSVKLAQGQQENVIIEKSLWEKLNHPNIVKFIGLAFTAKRTGFLLEYLPENLVERYNRAPLCDQDRICVLTDICKGLHYLHTLSSPIIHRDIRGTNVLLTADGKAKLTDLGLSRTLHNMATEHHSTVTHSTDWCAPETWSNISSVSTDIYSVGMTLLEITKGGPPFGEYPPSDPSRNMIIHRRITQGDIPSLPAGDIFTAIYKKCTEIDPNDRYASAEALRVAVEQLKS
ncbi:MAG: protein kinase, partial [Chlamydiia bacterium]|nr:protein kinase [Chlamydiia bacterium]